MIFQAGSQLLRQPRGPGMSFQMQTNDAVINYMEKPELSLSIKQPKCNPEVTCTHPEVAGATGQAQGTKKAGKQDKPLRDN